MSGPPHQFSTGFPNPQQTGLRNQFGPGQMANTMPGQMGGGMQNQMSSHMQNMAMGNQIGSQMTGPMSGQMAGVMPNQMMGQINQQYGMTPNMQNNLVQQQQAQNQLQMQQLQQQQMLHQQQQVQQSQQVSAPQSVTPNMVTGSVSGAPTVVSNPAATPSAPTQTKEFNIVSLCRFGQETVHDIVSRTQEVFQFLKVTQPPNGTTQGANTSNDRKTKIQEQLRTIRLLFKRLRLIYEKCNENCQVQGMEYTHIESLVPYKDELDVKSDEKKQTEAYRAVCDEHREYMEQVVLKNKQLKEVIDHLRRIIWEINTMLNMRRS